MMLMYFPLMKAKLSERLRKRKDLISIINQKYYKPEDLNYLSESDLLETELAQDSYEDSVTESEYDELLGKTRQLERVFNFHRSIIQHINTGLVTIDSKGKITFLNKAIVDMLGYSVQELQDKDINVLFKSLDTNIKEQLLNPPTREIELFCCTDKGHEIPVAVSCNNLHDQENSHEGIIIIIRDISDVYSLRKQMERMDRLAVLGEVAAGIAHEIRNPMAGVKLNAQLLQEEFGDNERIAPYTDRILREINRANKLLLEFFDFAKPSKPTKSLIDVEMIIDSVYLLLTPVFRKNGVKLLTDFSTLLPQVYVDPSQIEQVMINLFINAIDALKANEDEKSIRVLTRIVKRKEFDQRNYGKIVEMVEIQIIDNGVGIHEDLQEKIFNPFFTTKQDGVGLGLSISSRLIEENNGRLDVESELGKETRFIMLLPTS
jgi:PAS domain S-box-containing protein